MNIEQKRLGEVATYINGYPFKPEDRGIIGLPIIRIQDLTGNAYDLGFYNGKYPDRIEINDGDVLISWSASLGVYIWDRGKALLNQHIFKVVFDKTEVDKKYFVYAVQHKLKEMESKTHGATMKHIVKKDFDNTLIPFPSLEQQREVADILSKTANIIDARHQQLSALDDLIKARFVELFGDPEINPKGWEKGPLKDHAEVLVGYPFPSEGYSEEGIDIIGGYNLMQGYIQREDSKHWPNESGYEQYLLRTNDIVMAMDRPWVNGGFKIARIDSSHLPALLIQRTACIRSRDLQQEFLYILLDSHRFAEHCNITGSLVPHISNKDINSFQVILPPKELQEEFSAFVILVDKSRVVVQKALDEAQVLFDSLMQHYFG